MEQAYDHAVQTEKTLAFVDSIEWYDCLADIYQVSFFFFFFFFFLQFYVPFKIISALMRRAN